MKALVLTILLLSSAIAQAQPEVLGFRAWKSQRVEEARAALEKTQAESSPERAVPALPAPKAASPAASPAPARVQKGGKGETRLQQAQINFEFATELTINDYFVLYLSQMNNESAILEAAKKMSHEEVAELMMAYKKQLELGRSSVGMVPAKAPAAIGF